MLSTKAYVSLLLTNYKRSVEPYIEVPAGSRACLNLVQKMSQPLHTYKVVIYVVLSLLKFHYMRSQVNVYFIYIL